MKWISIKDKLPEAYQEVVVFYPATRHDTSIKEVVTYLPRDKWADAEFPSQLTHWCALPPDPEER